MSAKPEELLGTTLRNDFLSFFFCLFILHILVVNHVGSIIR